MLFPTTLFPSSEPAFFQKRPPPSRTEVRSGPGFLAPALKVPTRTELMLEGKNQKNIIFLLMFAAGFKNRLGKKHFLLNSESLGFRFGEKKYINYHKFEIATKQRKSNI